MAFIKQSEREKLIKKTEQKYGLRKFFITLELFLLLAFVAMVFASLYLTEVKGDANWYWIQKTEDNKISLTPMGIGMLVLSIVVIGLGLTSLILTWTLKSPKQIKANINKLNSSALSGKRIRGKKAVEVTRSRTTISKDKK